MRDTVGNYTTDLNGSDLAAPRPARRSPTPTTSGATARSATGPRPGSTPAIGAGKTFDYFKNVQGRNGIWNTGVGARSRVHYGYQLRQRVLGRHPDDLRRRREQRPTRWSSSTSPVTRCPTVSPRTPRRLVYTGEAGGLERGDVGHLRHRRGVVRQQRLRHPGLPHR